jgi:serine/threonine protein kinase
VTEAGEVEKIGKYQILGQIGQGAMGVVYKALDPFIERVVAVKTMSADLDSDPEVRARFYREARSAGLLSHKNIVTIYDLGEEGGRAYMVMEFLDGEDLKNIIARREQLPLERKLEFMRQLLEGLGHAHRRQVIHRDIKPGNLHVTKAGQLKILDFGLARISTSDITRTGSVMGTPNYMSPEQIRSEAVDHRSDIFSAGATFYELLTYRKPFHSSSLPSTFFKILQQDPDPLESVSPEIPPEFTPVVLRAVAKDPEKRYQSVDEMIRDLERLASMLRERELTLRLDAEQLLGELNQLVQENLPLLRKDEIEKLHRSGLAPAGPANSQDPEATFVGDPAGGYLEALSLRERARAECARLQEVTARRRETDALYRDALEHEKKGEFEDALNASEQAVARDPEHTDGAALVRRIRQGLLDRAVAEAREAVDRLARLTSDHPFLRDKASPEILSASLMNPASKDPDSTIEDDAGRSWFVELRDRAREEYSRLAVLLDQHRARAKLLDDALGLERRGLLAEGAAIIERVLAEEPGDPDAIGARARVQARIEENERRAKDLREARELSFQARTRFDEADFEQAVELLDRALALVPGFPEATELLSQTRRRLEEKAELERQRRLAAEALAEGESALRERDFARARKKLSAALGLDSKAEGANLLADRIARAEDEERQRKDREARARAAVDAARRAVRKGDEIEASRQLEALLQLDPGNEAAEELRSGVDKIRQERERKEKERRQRIESALAQGIEAHAAGNFEAAISQARSVLAEDAAQPGAANLLQRAERDLKLRRQREEIERAARDLVRNANSLAQQGRMRDAVAMLEKADSKVSGSPAVAEVLTRFRDTIRSEDDARARVEKEKQERISAALAAARLALTRSDPGSAVDHAKRALSEDPASPDALKLLETATRGLDAQRQREEIERKGSEVIREAEALAQQGDFAAALAVVKTADSRTAALEPVRRAFLRYQELVQKQQEAEERRKRVDEAWAAAGRQFEAGDLEACLKSAGLVLAIEPSHEGASELRSRAAAVLAEKRAQEERLRGADEALREAERAAKDARFDAARQGVARALAAVPSHPEAARLMSEIRRLESEAAERARREQQARQRLATAAERLSKNDIDGARQAYKDAIDSWPAVPGGNKLHAKIEKQARSSQRTGAPVPRQKVLPYAGIGVAGALAIVGLVYMRSGPSLPPARTEAQPSIQHGQPPPAVKKLNPPNRKPAPADGTVPPDNAAVQRDEKAAAALAADISKRNREARRLFDAGKYDDAMKSAGEVLTLAPEDREARRLLGRLEQYAQKGAMSAAQQMAQARAGADGSKAPSLAPQSWAAAQAGEAEAMRLFQTRQFGPATAKMYEVINLYNAAGADAVAAARAAEQERQRAADRADAERARQAYDQARSKAAAAGADRKAADSFRAATELADQARGKLEGGDFRSARGGYDAAAGAMLRSAETAGSDQREWDSLRNSRDTAALQAFAKKYPSSALADQAQRRIEQLDWDAVNKKDAAALKSFLQKHADGAYARQAEAEAAKLEQAAGAASDRQAIRQALTKYAAAYDQMDARALQEAWPGIPREILSTISQSFKNARSTRMELRPLEEPAVSGDTAIVPCQRLISQTFDKKPIEAQDRIAVRLRRRGAGWVIDSIQ